MLCGVDFLVLPHWHVTSPVSIPHCPEQKSIKDSKIRKTLPQQANMFIVWCSTVLKEPDKELQLSINLCQAKAHPKASPPHTVTVTQVLNDRPNTACAYYFTARKCSACCVETNCWKYDYNSNNIWYLYIYIQKFLGEIVPDDSTVINQINMN